MVPASAATPGRAEAARERLTNHQATQTENNQYEGQRRQRGRAGSSEKVHAPSLATACHARVRDLSQVCRNGRFAIAKVRSNALPPQRNDADASGC
jgi:hypothetical protein